MRRVLRRSAKIFLVVVLAYLIPKVVLVYLACGLYDVLRNDERNVALIERYFLGNGILLWLLSPANVVLDLLSLPYSNKGVYRLEDLPPGHRREIVALIEVARRNDLVGQLGQAASGGTRSMFFFKWYGANVDTVTTVPEFHKDYEWITTIGVSVFNRKQSTSKHFGPLRASLRVLYNLNDAVDDSAYIVVGRTTHVWREEKLFIFDDTLLHQSFNETDQTRINLFVDIVRPTTIPAAFRAFIRFVGLIMSQGINKVFYARWKVFKTQ